MIVFLLVRKAYVMTASWKFIMNGRVEYLESSACGEVQFIVSFFVLHARVNFHFVTHFFSQNILDLLLFTFDKKTGSAVALRPQEEL